MIPRIIHQFWDKPTPPRSVADQIETWRTLNPAYQHILWNDETAAAYLGKMVGPDAAALFKACALPASRADVFRCAVLFLQGGVYVDADQQCMKPLDTLLEGVDADALLYHVPFRHKSGAVRWRLRNDFMAGPARSPFFGRALATIFNNIRTRSSQNVWALTGPGVIRATYDALPPHLASHVLILGRERAFQYTRPNYQLDYVKEQGHWSEQMKNMDIVTACSVSTAFRCVDTMFVGHPRCGSASLSAALCKARLDIPHERLGADGIVSWWHTGRARMRGSNVLLERKLENGSETWLVQRVVQYLRSPADAIPSIVLENEHNGRDNNSFRYRAHTLKRLYGVELAALDDTAAAATSYALWNRRAEEISNGGSVMIEMPRLSELYPGLEFDTLPQRNTSAAKFRQEKPQVDIGAVLQRMPAEARPWLTKYMELYEVRKAQEGS